MVRREGEGEQQVAQSIRPLEKFDALRFGPMQRPQFTLGPTGDRACHVELGRYARAARKYERPELRMRGVESVDLGLEARHVPRFDPVCRWLCPGSDRQLGLCNVQLVLQPANRRGDVPEGRWKVSFEHSELRAQLVERAVRADARRILLYARTTGETRGASVAGTGIEPRDTLISGRQGSASSGELSPWTGQYEMCSTSLCLAS